MSESMQAADDVREFYSAYVANLSTDGLWNDRHAKAAEKFDRWLADRDREVKAEARAEGTREAAAYIDRLFANGLVSKAAVLAALGVVADRQAQRFHANGIARANELEQS